MSNLTKFTEPQHGPHEAVDKTAVLEATGVLSLFFAGYLMGSRVGLPLLSSLLSSLAIGLVGGLIILQKVLTH